MDSFFQFATKEWEKIQLIYFFIHQVSHNSTKMSSSTAHTLIVKALKDPNAVSAKELIAAAESARDEETAVALLRLITYRAEHWLWDLTENCDTLETFRRLLSIVSESKYAFDIPRANDVYYAMLCRDVSMFYIIMANGFVCHHGGVLRFGRHMIGNGTADLERIKFLFDTKIIDPDHELLEFNRYFSWFEWAVVNDAPIEMLEMLLEYARVSKKPVFRSNLFEVVRSRMRRVKQVALMVLVCRQLMNSPGKPIETMYFTLSILQAAFEQLLSEVDSNLMDIAFQPVRFGLLLAKSKQLGISIPANAVSYQWFKHPDTMDFHEMEEYGTHVIVTIHRTEEELWKSICEK